MNQDWVEKTRDMARVKRSRGAPGQREKRMVTKRKEHSAPLSTPARCCDSLSPAMRFRSDDKSHRVGILYCRSRGTGVEAPHLSTCQV